ncbi:hypothetical protein [Microcoleus sp. bin38.metabat.b11b12b14.051]|uniref:hypothetical protein n=1 Tax=Microcoleus sp. bin38.metabat.b11b12b14.051 TaxID=2742709 RepID=UPI0025CF1AB2|nr:hypothetical protein [Microcoleus sp. bin38.metabat.b11b12b14.051]
MGIGHWALGIGHWAILTFLKTAIADGKSKTIWELKFYVGSADFSPQHFAD